MDSALSEEFGVNVGMHQGSLLSPFSFAVVVDVLTEFACEGALNELYAVLSETINGLWNKFLKWKECFESKGLKVNLGKTRVMVSSCITKDGFTHVWYAAWG